MSGSHYRMKHRTVLTEARRRWSSNDRLTTSLKASFAAMCAWLVARYLLGHQSPYFAPVAALVSVRATVVQSFRDGVRYAAGFVLGVIVAVTSVELLGPNLLSLGITLITGTLLGTATRFGGQGLEVPFTATFVLLLGGSHPEDFVLSRLLDVAVGVPIGIAVNTLVLAPLHVEPAAHALRRLADDIADLLDEMADGLTAAWPVKNPDWYERSQALDPALRDVLPALSNAHESLRLNPRGTLQPDSPRSLELLWDCFADLRGSTQSIAYSITRASDDAASRPDRPSWLDEGFRLDYAEVLQNVSLVIRHRLSPTPRPGPDTDHSSRALDDLREEIYGRPERSHAPWYTQSHLLIELDRMLQNVCSAIEAGERARPERLPV
jgi:hypothetical protein